ncbi:hypothetical protein ACFU8X_29810 [Brevibacillus porteri]
MNNKLDKESAERVYVLGALWTASADSKVRDAAIMQQLHCSSKAKWYELS